MTWGFNKDGQTNVPPGLEGVIGLAASDTYSGILGNETPAPFAPALEPVYDKGVFAASFDGKRGFAYRLEFCETLGTGAWTLGSPLPGDGNRARLFDSATAPARFYVIRRLW